MQQVADWLEKLGWSIAMRGGTMSWKEDRRERSTHEAAHAVVARKLGLAVPRVTIRKGQAHATHESASYFAQTADVATRIEALEKDAIVAQAGYTADVYEYPHPLKARDLFDVDDQDTDTTNTRSAIFKMVCLETGRTFPDDGGNIKLDENMTSAMNDVYHRIIDKAHALVDQHWHTIVRVAKHLERHGDIDNQAVLDSLIERAAAT